MGRIIISPLVENNFNKLSFKIRYKMTDKIDEKRKRLKLDKNSKKDRTHLVSVI